MDMGKRDRDESLCFQRAYYFGTRQYVMVLLCLIGGQLIPVLPEKG